MFRRIAICLLILSLCTIPALAADKKPQLKEAPSVPAEVQIDPDQQAIADYWSTLTPGADEPYLTQPSVVSPYLIGELNPTYTDTGLRYLNFLRSAICSRWPSAIICACRPSTVPYCWPPTTA